MADKLDDKKTSENEKFYCNICHFHCGYISDYNRHIITAKHKRLTEADKKNEKKRECINEFKCKCGKSYMQRQGLFKHKKKCTYIEDITFGNYNELLLQTLNNCDN